MSIVCKYTLSLSVAIIRKDYGYRRTEQETEKRRACR